jgi:hypothetical protein
LAKGNAAKSKNGCATSSWCFLSFLITANGRGVASQGPPLLEKGSGAGKGWLSAGSTPSKSQSKLLFSLAQIKSSYWPSECIEGQWARKILCLIQEGTMRKSHMIVRASLTILMWLLPLTLLGQGKGEHSGLGYLFFAPGAISCDRAGTLHIGGGGEAFFYKGLGFGAEVGYLAPWKTLGDGIGVLSLDGVYQFKPAKKTVPFVLGGYSLAFRSSTANAINFGAGVNYWFHDKVGLRLEFRDHVPIYESNCHFLGFRIGLSFR